MRLMSRTANGWQSVELFQQSAITGVPAIKRRWEVGLGNDAAKAAFISSRNVCELDLPGLSYDDMTSALVVCADQLYANVESMTPAQRVHGAIQNALGLVALISTLTPTPTPTRAPNPHLRSGPNQADHEAVVYNATFLEAPEPFDARAACREELDTVPPSRSSTPVGVGRPGAELDASVERWLGCWGGLQLGELPLELHGLTPLAPRSCTAWSCTA